MGLDNDGRLHVRMKCSVCFGTKSNRNGGACPYCDMDGKNFIEASMNVLKDTLQVEYSKEEKDELLQCLISGSDF